MKRFPLDLPALILLISLLIMAGGCIIIPIPHEASASPVSRGIVHDHDTAFAHHGSTTREEVILRLGQPDLAWRHEQVLLYGWSESTLGVFIAVAAPGGGAADYIEDYKPRYLIMEFDSAGRFQRLDRPAIPPSKSPRDFIRSLMMSSSP